MHGVQGDCEFFGVADEVRGEVELVCDVVKGKRVPYPRLETDDKLIQVYCYRPLEDAIRSATRLLMEWLVEDFSLTEKQAYWLVAVNPDFRIVIGNMVNFEQIQYTVTAEISKASLERAV
jgi:acetamidase/formamidase